MNTTLAERLKIVRGKIPQAEFADIVGIHKSSWGRFERGETEPSGSDLIKICSVCGVFPAWLLLGEGPVFSRESKGEYLGVSGPAPKQAYQPRFDHCAELEAELKEERAERRELAEQNRKLWEKNSELIAMNGELNTQVAKLEAEVQKPGIYKQDIAQTGAA